MTEYIVEEPNEHSASWRVHERIVRCRDCKHMHRVRHWLGMDVDECWRNADPESGALGKEPTEPDGFCSWGERKEDAEGGAAPESYIRSDEEGSICPAPRTSVIFEGQKFTFDAAESEVFKRLLIAHLRRLAGLGVDA